ncbi:zinc-finger homeodomain protein 11-like [Pyrus x bretschneideri]|uniref:zinc-finger homeodomain protein 11-like n=1 Tax=Pyrus x bretschneideri TaxID=225117 RepID=UPI0020304202|nr:zinc-finger homeodomain protein 11-like [Pyrus x bretschneideri]
MNFTTVTATIQTPDTDTEPPSPSDPKSNFFSSRSLSFTNGAFQPHSTPTMVVAYKECLKNHAASLGGHALDGCGEFMPSPSSNPADPTSLKCAACGCHRNFHRLDQYRPKSNVIRNPHRLLPAPKPAHYNHSSSPSPSSSPNPTLSPQSPPPVSHLPPSYFASPPQMLLALSSGFSGPSDEHPHQHQLNPTAVKKTEKYPGEKKRSRTRFSQEQKEKMSSFAEKVGWRLQKSEERLVEDFCSEVGIGRGVFKVWMHNNKHGRRRLERSGGGNGSIGGGGNMNKNVSEINGDGERLGFDSMNAHIAGYNVNANPLNEGSRASFHLSNNGSSSSS